MAFDPNSAFDPENIQFDASTAFDPDSIIEEEEDNKGENTVINAVQDVGRLLLSPATIGVNAIIGGVQAAASGKDILQGASDKAQSPEFLGFNTNMETSPGKLVEEKLGTALEAVRENSGEFGADLLKNDKYRAVLKAMPSSKALVWAYEQADEQGKAKLEGLLSGTAAATPEILLTILGGTGAKKAIEKPKATEVVDIVPEEPPIEAKPLEETTTLKVEEPPVLKNQDELPLATDLEPKGQLDLFEPEANDRLNAMDAEPIDFSRQPESVNETPIVNKVEEPIVTEEVTPAKAPIKIDDSDPKSFLRAVDKGIGILSTRLGKESPAILQRAVNYEQALLQNTHKQIGSVDKFLSGINKLDKSTLNQVNSLLLNEKYTDLNKVLKNKDPNLAKEIVNVQNTLKNIGQELVKSGRLTEDAIRENHFPRVVKDVKGLLNSLGIEQRGVLQKRLREAEIKSGGLDDVERSAIINKYLRGVGNKEYKPGFAKQRVFDEVTPDMEKFYATPTQAIHTYLRSAVADIEARKFFGRNADLDSNGKLNLEESIGKLVLDELNAGNISEAGAANIADMLRSRFGPGNQGANSIVQGAKDVANIGLLGNVISSTTQLADIATPIYVNGLKPTIMALAKQLSGKKELSMRDFGLMDNASQEFVGDRFSSQMLSKTFQLVGFSAIDAIGKNTLLNSTIIKARDLAKTEKGIQQLAGEWQARFGDEFPQLIADLKSGKKTELTDTLAFSKLSKVQPITKLELPQKYLDMPNGRVIYMMKTFMLKQMDLVRNEIADEFRKGNIRKASANATRYALVLGMSGASVQYIKDLMMGKDPETPDISDVPLNLLKTFGWSEYVANDVKQGNIGKAVGSLVLPPYQMFDEAIRDALKGDEAKGKWMKLVPGFGKILYARGYEGQMEQEEKDRQKEMKKLKEELDL